ncbi:hypothetical protein VTP01DRAFT_7902 [Rhizomucor pusillus]|uniref:uncharacterized protein n=1 Tax=Rhizomucor pusillus TaxID=4840 RepID=UPI0037424C46
MKQAEKALCGRLFVWACSKKRVGGKRKTRAVFINLDALVSITNDNVGIIQSWCVGTDCSAWRSFTEVSSRSATLLKKFKAYAGLNESSRRLMTEQRLQARKLGSRRLEGGKASTSTRLRCLHIDTNPKSSFEERDRLSFESSASTPDINREELIGLEGEWPQSAKSKIGLYLATTSYQQYLLRGMADCWTKVQTKNLPQNNPRNSLPLPDSGTLSSCGTPEARYPLPQTRILSGLEGLAENSYSGELLYARNSYGVIQQR